MRLSPLPADQWDDAARHAVSGMLPEERRNPQDAGNVLSTLVRHPKLTRAYLRFSSYSAVRVDAAAADPRAGHPARRPSPRLRL